MTIEKRANGKYRITQMLDGKRYRITVDHKPTKREAEELIRDLIDASKDAVGKGFTFEKAFESYLSSKLDVLSPSTEKSYRGDYKQLSHAFCKTDIDDLNQIIIQREINSIAKRVSPKTTRNVHGIVSAVLKMFRPDLKLFTTLPQAKRKELDLYLPTKEEVHIIIDAARGTPYYVPFVLGICGMRRSEIMAVKASDLDGNKLYIRHARVASMRGIVEKDAAKTTNSTRFIYIPQDAADIIREQGHAYDGYPNNITRRIHIIQDKNNIPRFRFHDLRAYYASYAHILGIPDQLIQEAGGWKTDYTMKKIYRRTMQEEYKKSQETYLDNLNDMI